MRDYIILNGVNSNTITGLLISTLPPITKPKQRTQIEEIDGRDGDIVTKLGYSAYDKEFEIGLYGDFDIDEVISYFNSEGTVVFSNENDKYYNYQILDQIDYEKLIRFKKAKIKMHVQPFKYPLGETPVEINIQNVTGSGEAISIDNTAEAPVTLALKGNTSQNGTPTPTTPVEVNTVTGRQEIIISNGTDTQSYELDLGKNLFDKNSFEWVRNNNGNYTNTTDTSTNRIRTQTLLKLEGGTTYTISGIPSGMTINAIKFYSSPSDTNQTSFVQTSTFTIPSNAIYVIIQLAGTNFDSSTNSIVKNANIQIEKGNQATSYVEYKTPIELCKIGDYQDYFYKDSGKWYLEKQVGKVVLNGSENWNVNQRTSGYQFDTQLNGKKAGSNTIVEVYSNYFTCTYFNNRDNILNSIYTGNNDSSIRILTNVESTTTNFKNWLSTHNTTVYYVLATPTTTEITDNTLIGQLNALENARSYDPTTNISQNTPNKPFIIDATAVQKGSDTGIVDNIGNIYAKPTIDIEGSGIVEIYLDGNQIFNVDLSTINECVIDTTNLEAYNPATTQLMNRQVTGDYSNFKINVGDNQVKVSGAVTKATISNYTRWL